LSDQALDIIARGEIDALGQFFDVQRDDVFHGDDWSESEKGDAVRAESSGSEGVNA
jgi:hypothetical protein